MTRALAVVLISGMVLAVSTVGLCQSSGSISIQWGDPPAPSLPHGGVDTKTGGPPRHAPAHGYRAKHQYCYYPYHNVYYEPAKGMYFYLSGDGWAFGASLPASLTGVGLGTFVNIDLDSDRPHDFNHDHVKKYPKEKYKPDKADKGNGHGNKKGKGGKKS